MLQPRSITSMFNYPRVPQCRVLLNYLQRYFFCFSCAAWTMMWQPLGANGGDHKSSAGNFTRPRPKQEANMLKICLILSRQALPLPGMIDVGTLTGGANGSVNSAMWIPRFPARFLDPRSVLYCLFNRPNELQPLFGSLQLSLCFPKLEHCTEAVKVGCCPERAMALSESPCMAGLFSNHASEALEVSRPQKND